MDGIGLLLEREGIEYVRIDGMTPPYARPRRLLAASVQYSSDLQFNCSTDNIGKSWWTTTRTNLTAEPPCWGTRIYVHRPNDIDAGGDIDVFFLLSSVPSLSSAGVGLTMPKAEAVIMTELYWNPGVRSPFALTYRHDWSAGEW
mgnify:CR=1 FL=1